MEMIMGAGFGECALKLEISFAVVGFGAKKTFVPQLNLEGD